MNRDPAEKMDDRTVVLVSVAKRQWERTFDAISEPLMIIDADYVIRRANLALADSMGIAIQRVVGRKCHEVRAESTQAFPKEAESSPCEGCPVPQADQKKTVQEGELRSLAGRVYRLRAYPLDDEATPLMVCSYRDVTEEREMTRQLSNAEKLAAIGRLAGGVAHEINNPLGGILAFAQILLREEVSPGERKEYLGEIEKSALRCKAIVESLLRFSRQSPQLQRRHLSINDVVKEALQFANYKYAIRDVEIVCRLADNLPPVFGNANQLEQVLVNLLSNAFDSVTSARERERGRIEVSTSVREGWVELEVRDTGSGIKEGHMAKIFDPFFTTKEEGRGTGLGLAVTYAIVREHDGRIAARNEAGRGAVFTVGFPIATTPREIALK
jgi:two-component system NtrC family sensor kinase